MHDLIEPFPTRNYQIDGILEDFEPQKRKFSVAMRKQSQHALEATRISTLQQIEENRSSKASDESVATNITASICSGSLASNQNKTLSSQRCDDALSDVNSYYDKLLVCVNDNDEFRRLKQEMRKRNRSGFASHQILYDLIKEDNIKSARSSKTSIDINFGSGSFQIPDKRGGFQFWRNWRSARDFSSSLTENNSVPLSVSVPVTNLWKIKNQDCRQ